MTNSTQSKFRKRSAVPLACVLLLWAAALALSPQRAMAIGTPAGTVISNQAYVDYEDANGNSLARVYSNTVTTTVSQVASVDITPDADTKASDNSVTAYFPFDINNDGNATDSFDITYAVDGASDWTPVSVKFYLDLGTVGVYEPGTDTEITAPYSVSNVAADAAAHVILAVEVPANSTAPDGDSNIINVTAASQFDNAETDVSAFTTTVSAAIITAVKSTSPTNPQPGDTVTYTITVTNSGTTDADSVVLTDSIPADTTFVTTSITLAGAGKSDADDADEADFNVTTAGAVTVSPGTLASGGGSAVITFQVTVDAGVPAGTTVANSASVAFVSGGNNLSVASNGSNFTVGQLADVDIASAAPTASGDPGDQIVYSFSITNQGNDDDVLDITYSSGQGWTWIVWVDDDGNGIPGTGSDYQLTDTDSDTVIDTGTLAQNQSLTNLLLAATIPAGTADATVDVTTVTVTSSIDTGVTDAQDFTTTVTAPVLTISKTVSPTGDQPPGTTLVYTITVSNTGTGGATSIVIKDVVPPNTTYTTGSILTGATAGALASRTDSADADEGSYDSGGDTIECGTTGTATLSLSASSTFVCRFSVVID